MAREDFKITKHSDKVDLKKQMDHLENTRKTKNIGEVIEYVFSNKLLKIPSKIKDFKKRFDNKENIEDEKVKKDREFYNSLMQTKYDEVININEYIEKQTPFSTKHGVKGAEYDNVLVVIDDSWNMYKDNDVFANNTKNQGRYERTKNLLYVCCSRAKDNLALLSLSQMDNTAMNNIESLFGNDIYDVTNL